MFLTLPKTHTSQNIEVTENMQPPPNIQPLSQDVFCDQFNEILKGGSHIDFKNLSIGYTFAAEEQQFQVVGKLSDNINNTGGAVYLVRLILGPQKESEDFKKENKQESGKPNMTPTRSKAKGKSHQKQSLETSSQKQQSNKSSQLHLAQQTPPENQGIQNLFACKVFSGDHELQLYSNEIEAYNRMMSQMTKMGMKSYHPNIVQIYKYGKISTVNSKNEMKEKEGIEVDFGQQALMTTMDGENHETAAVNIAPSRKITRGKKQAPLYNQSSNANTQCGSIPSNNKQQILSQQQEACFIIMDYCESGDLKHVLDEVKGKPEVIKSIFRGILEGVRFMHDDCLMAHLDIKPCNILITKGLVPKIIDFAYCCESKIPQILEVGTSYSIAPEIFSSKHLQQTYDPVQADVYSLGILLFIMLFGFPPLPTSDWKKLQENEFLFYQFKRLVSGSPVNINYFLTDVKIKHEYADSLIGLMTSMLNFKPDKRPSIKQVLAEDPWLNE